MHTAQRRVIGADLDGCFCDFNRQFMRVLVDVTGEDRFPPDYEPHTWDYPQALGYAEEEVALAWAQMVNEPFWSRVRPYPDAPAVLRALRSLSPYRDVYFITARKGVTVKSQTENWLEDHGYPRPTVLITPFKGLAAAALNLTHYIDDNLQNCAEVAAVGVATYLLDRPWNRDNTPTGVERVSTLSDFINVIV